MSTAQFTDVVFPVMVILKSDTGQCKVRLSFEVVALPAGVSEFLCKRFGLQLIEMRSPNSMVKRVSAAFQSRMGMLHFWLILRRAR